MSSEANGKNIMPNFNRYFLSVFFLLLIFVLVLGCGKSSDDGTNGTEDTVTTAAMTEDEKLEALINETMQRLKYKEKSFIYDMEFSYYRDQVSFDSFLQLPKIKNAQADSLEFVDVISVEYFGEDSAKALAEIHFVGPTGHESVLKNQPVVFYRVDGRWIKPTISTIDGQKKYDEIIEKAKSAAKSEKGG